MTLPKEKILIVEDERDLVLLLEYNLRRAGYRVLSAHDAESGLELARAQKPDIVLLDIALPGMDGYEFHRRLRPESRVPVLFLTGRDSALLGTARLEATDALLKPFSIPELLEKIAAMLRRAHAPSS